MWLRRSWLLVNHRARGFVDPELSRIEWLPNNQLRETLGSLGPWKATAAWKSRGITLSELTGAFGFALRVPAILETPCISTEDAFPQQPKRLSHQRTTKGLSANLTFLSVLRAIPSVAEDLGLLDCFLCLRKWASNTQTMPLK